MLRTDTITQVANSRDSRDSLYAFRIAGKVTRDDMTAMSELMNAVFDQPGKVDMLLIFDSYQGSEPGASMSWEALKSRARAVTNVNRYVVAKAPDSAQDLVETMGSLLPVKAEAYDDEFAAWGVLNAEAVPA